jgi:leucyl/phenylalanyl-tRNA--protein transferase
VRRFVLPHIIDPRRPPFFPEDLHPDRYGLVAIGGDLSEPVLLEAYSRGIFPWFDQPPLMWYSPDPRMVLYPGEYHLPHRLARVIRQGRFRVAFDHDFAAVIAGCAAVPRPGQQGTWITPNFVEAYTHMHEAGWAHCVSVYSQGALCGGLYGISLGRVFCGESMFSLVPNASKVAFAALVEFLRGRGFALIDCQAPTRHLLSLGALPIPRRRFVAELAAALQAPTLRGSWAPRTDGAMDAAGRAQG